MRLVIVCLQIKEPNPNDQVLHYIYYIVINQVHALDLA